MPSKKPARPFMMRCPRCGVVGENTAPDNMRNETALCPVCACVGQRSACVPVVEPKERPILFSAPMVCALLDGRKTQTRRLAKHRHRIDFLGGGGDKGPDWNDPAEWGFAFDGPAHHGWAVLGRGFDERHSHGRVSIPSPYGDAGDRLWVRETWAPFYAPGGEGMAPCGEDRNANAVRYRATPDIGIAYPTSSSSWTERLIAVDEHRWRPSIFMPRWASRILLEVTDVRVERLQNISKADAIAEGIEVFNDDGVDYYGPYGKGHADPVEAYRILWESINGAESWTANPWVWVVGFKVVEVRR